jgi:hypothetical protein
VREYKGPSGDRRLWYDPGEIDTIMVDELVRARLLPDAQQDDLSVDIEAFVETYLHLPFDLNAKLDAAILGVTDFVPGKKPKISVNRDLTGSALDDEDSTPGLLGRWRATVAHEACHVLLHRMLYELDDLQRGLFRSPQEPSLPQHLLRCLKRDVAFTSRVSDWREVQANIGMGALLMPKPIFLVAAAQGRVLLGAANRAIETDSPTHEEIVTLLARRFTVSKQAARIRLATLRIVHPPGQHTL